MVKQLEMALLAGVFVASTAGAVHDADVSDLEFKCQAGQNKASAKFFGCKAKCVGRCIAGARKVPPLNPQEDCYPPFGGTTLTCIADPIKGCEAKGIAAINKACVVLDPTKTDCPECYSARGGDANCNGHGEDVIVDGLSNPTGAGLEAQADAFLLSFEYCDDWPNTAAENECESGLVKALVKFVGCKSKCYDKCNHSQHKGAIPPGSCNPPLPADLAAQICLFDSIKGCEAKLIAACNKACITPPADAPECYSFTCSSIASLTETWLDGDIWSNYCGSPSGAFVVD
jgi:hypothetical protein